MIIEITNETDFEVSSQLEKGIETAIVATLDHEDMALEGEVSVLLVSNDHIQSLNRDFRHKDAVTDVLSFPQYDNLYQTGFDEDYLYLGDIVISLERAQEQAEDFGHTFEREVLYLIVHSVLHLLGYDHMEETDKTLMRSREKEIFKTIEVFK